MEDFDAGGTTARLDVVTGPPCVWLGDEVQERLLTMQTARDLAHWLLSAADEVEKAGD